MASRRSTILFLVVGGATALICLGLFVLAGLAGQRAAEPGRALTFNALLALIVVAGGFALLWWRTSAELKRRAAALSDEIDLIARANPRHVVDVAHYAGLEPLPAAVNALAARLREAREEGDGRAAAATRSLAEQKRWLEAILSDLTEGVVVCNMNHQVLLYNQVALKLLQVAGELGLGRSLFNLVTRQPILHAIELLTFRLRTQGTRPGEDATAPVVCASTDARSMLRGRISLILDAQRDPTGYVLTFSDVTQEIATLGKRDALLTQATEGMRAPLANLRAAIETVAAFPAMPPEQRQSFDQVVMRESNDLSERLEAVATGYRELVAGYWPMAPIYSLDLLNCVVQRAGEDSGVSLVGLPVWLHGDSYGLMLALSFLLGHVRRHIGGEAIDIGTVPGQRRHYIDFAWDGAPIPSGELDRWAAEPLDPSAGSLTLRDVLDRHRSEIWSQPTAPGRAILRLPIAAAEHPPIDAGLAPRPPRPEFYDFALMHQALPTAALGDRPLRSLSYVVFDTETTGLDAARGDEIVQIAGVRIVNGRILTGETFERLVNPGRRIPPESTRFHGITDDTVKDKPPIHVVLPQFRDFVADSVLVAHNAAFDLSFLRPKEAEAGVGLDNPVLDSQLLAARLHENIDDSSLDGLARRLGVDIVGRHTAGGDALMTAAVFLRLMELLEAQGVVTLNEAIKVSNVEVELRRRKLAV
ncbi:MAG: exonuclease [Alphaproteobacteria bacterium]|nr:exonuclease [Alphaproteobacteria bacterium]